MKYLHYSDFRDIGDNLEYGQKVRVNHSASDCQGSSNSLLIERRDNGDISAYCFRCGRCGFHGSKTTLKSKILGDQNGSTQISADRTIDIPEPSQQAVKDWPVRARLWINQYGITQEEVDEYGIVYSEPLSRVCLPIRDADGLASFQSRQIHQEDTGPKYLTSRARDCAPIFGDISSGVVVLVEDMLSAIKVARVLPAMPLLSTKLRDIHVKSLLSKGFTKYIIWLDDDNIQVKQHQLANKRVLDKLGECVIIHTEGRDPKEHTDEEIREILL